MPKEKNKRQRQESKEAYTPYTANVLNDSTCVDFLLMVYQKGGKLTYNHILDMPVMNNPEITLRDIRASGIAHTYIQLQKHSRKYVLTKLGKAIANAYPVEAEYLKEDLDKPEELLTVLRAIEDKTNLVVLAQKANMQINAFKQALNILYARGFIEEESGEISLTNSGKNLRTLLEFKVSQPMLYTEWRLIFLIKEYGKKFYERANVIINGKEAELIEVIDKLESAHLLKEEKGAYVLTKLGSKKAEELSSYKNAKR